MASADYNVLTPERVSLQYDIAGIGSRGAAVMVDSAIQAATLAVVVIGLTGLFAALGGLVFAGGAGASAAIAVVVLAIFGVSNGYFIAFEIAWSGQTPGKRVVGVRVIRENGYPIRPVDAVVRNLIRLVDWLPFFYGVGILTMLFNSRSKRLGDFASGTIVVREARRDAFTVSGAPGDEDTVVRLSNPDATLVRDFLVRRDSLEPIARTELAQRLAAALSHRYGLAGEPDAERFLERLAG